MNVTLEKATICDAEELIIIQKKAFKPLFDIYNDERNPYYRGMEEIEEWLSNDKKYLYKILSKDVLVGGICVVDRGDDIYYLTRLYITQDMQSKGIASKAIKLCELLHPNAKKWMLDFPIDQVANKKCYEKVGYVDTGNRSKINDKLTLALYEKNISGIYKMRESQLDICTGIIRNSFITVANELGLTEENCERHPSFYKTDKLKNDMNKGYLLYGVYNNRNLIGYFSLSKEDNGNFYEIHNLSILPKYRHLGYGTQILNYCKTMVKEWGSNIIKIDIIEVNTKLKNWYLKNDFVTTSIERVEHLPFKIIGYMEWINKM